MRPRSLASSVVRLARSPSGCLRLAVGDELQGEHRAEAAHLADRGHRRGDARRAAREAVRRARRPVARNVGRRHLVQHGERRRARERIAPERAPEPTGMRSVHHLGPAGDARERQPAAERLPRDDEVRLNAVVLDRPDRPRAADARLHLVVDVEDAVRREQLLEPSREVVGHRDEAALALHRLEHRAGHRLRVDVAAEEILERLERGLGSRRRGTDTGPARGRPRARTGRSPSCR